MHTRLSLRDRVSVAIPAVFLARGALSLFRLRRRLGAWLLQADAARESCGTEGGRSPWAALEWALLAVFLAVKLLLAFRLTGVPWGYDVEGHLANVDAISWTRPFLALQSSYYAHHPPLAFLLAKTVSLIPSHDLVRSVQVVSLLSLLLGFFAVRSTLRALGMLSYPPAIAFLYATFSLPLHVYGGILIGIDPLVFLWTCLTLLLSVRLSLADGRGGAVLRVLLVSVLALAMLTKYTGVVLLALPVLVALIRRPVPWRTVLHVLLLCALAAAVVFPYYFLRYYQPTGTFFFDSAGLHAWTAEVAASRAYYHGHLGRFLPHLFLYREQHLPWLLPTWRGFWMGFDRPPQTPFSLPIAELYARGMPVLLLLGGIAHAARGKRHATWRRLGWMLVLFSLLLLTAMTFYIYTFPLEWYFNNKAIYVFPASLAIGFLLSGVFELPSLLFPRRRATRIAAETSLFAALVLFMGVNYLLPVF